MCQMWMFVVFTHVKFLTIFAKKRRLLATNPFSEVYTFVYSRLRYSQKGFLTIAGFSELSDAEYDDIEPWLPHVPIMEPKMDVETSKYVIAKIGEIFCQLVGQEHEARSWAGDEG